jgi:hypothetical protein
MDVAALSQRRHSEKLPAIPGPRQGRSTSGSPGSGSQPYARSPPNAESASGGLRSIGSVQTLTTFSAAGPFWPWVMSNSTVSPSFKDLKPSA